MNPFMQLIDLGEVSRQLETISAKSSLPSQTCLKLSGAGDRPPHCKETWSVPGIGEVNRAAVMALLSLTKPQLSNLVTQANQRTLRPVFRCLLQMYISEQAMVESAARLATAEPAVLRSDRKQSQLTQEDMAGLTGYATLSIGHWESLTSTYRPAPTAYRILCALLRTEPQVTQRHLYAEQNRPEYTSG